MGSHGGTGTANDVPDTNADDNIWTSGRDQSEVVSLGDSSKRRSVAWLPILLGVCVCALNVLVAFRLWKVLYNNKLQGNVAVALLATSLFIGLFLIAYGITLRRSEPRLSSPGYVKWVVAPLVVAIAAYAATVWAAGIAEPKPSVQTPCIDLYQRALTIQKDKPQFRIPSGDRDDARCKINDVLR